MSAGPSLPPPLLPTLLALLFSALSVQLFGSLFPLSEVWFLACGCLLAPQVSLKSLYCGFNGVLKGSEGK